MAAPRSKAAGYGPLAILAPMTQPFDGVRIIDFSQGIAGPMATMHLADFGAEVIKVEPPGGDRMRSHPGYLTWNRNKKRTSLDLATFEGRQAARGLLASAQAAVFDASPGELERIGFDGVSLTTAFPGLLHVWMPPYATAGRWSHLPPSELLLAALTGVAHMQMSFEDQPVSLVTPQLGYAQAAIAANGIAAGLWEQAKSGRGQAIVVSGIHGVSSVESGGGITAGGIIRLGRNSRGGAAHYRLYRCADDEWFFLGCLTAPFFIRALEAIGMLEVLMLPGVEGEFTNLLRSPEAAEQAQQMLEARFVEKPRAEWMAILQEAGVPKGPVGIREEWFREETVTANKMRLVLEHPKHGRVEMPGVSVKLGDTPGSVRGFAEDVKVTDLAGDTVISRAAQPAESTRGRPLAGVRVLDLGAFIAGTFAPTVLANYGADVIKVEPIDGDPFRTYGLIFYGHNLGKRSIALDLKSDAGREVFRELVRQSDVILDNFRLGVRERLGIDYATLSALNPRIITCSVTGYGTVGPLAADPGFDPLLQARSGMMRAQGGDDEPVFHQIAINDSATAMMAAFGIQAALHAREKTGRGQEVLTCLANQTILFQSGELTHFEGREPSPTGGRDFLGLSALHRYYRCADGWIGIACSEASQFHDLALALGHPEWAGRVIAEKALHEASGGVLGTAIAETLAAMPRAEALDRLGARGVPVAPVVRVEEMFEDLWLVQNRFFQEIDDPQWGPLKCMRSYADWGRSEGGFPRRTPQMGEQSEEILAEFGFSGERIAELLSSGVVFGG